MNRQFEEASVKLKDLLALKGVEVLNLKKQLAEKGLWKKKKILDKFITDLQSIIVGYCISSLVLCND